MELEMSQDGLDLPPEYCHYRDEGCDLAGFCLNCPLPICPSVKEARIDQSRC